MKTKDERKYYDITPGQQLLLYSQTFTIHKQINNIFTSILLEKKLDFDVLKSAIEYAYEQNDAFRLRMTKVDGKIKQYFADTEKPEVGLLDFTGKTQEEMDEHLSKIAHKPIRILDKPVTKVFLLRSWNGMDGIYFGVSHMVLDSWGICVFLQYVMEVYEAMKADVPMPKALSPLEPLLQKDLEYKNSPKFTKDMEFWQNEFKSRESSLISHINGPSVLENFRKKKKDPSLRYAKTTSLTRTAARHEVLYVPKRDVDKIQEFCETQKISMQAVFMFGVRTALSKLNDCQDDVGIYVTCARRGTLQEKRSGGSRVHSAIFRTIIKEDTTFETACQETFKYQTQIYRYADFDTIEMINMEAKEYNRKGYFTGWHTVIFTFQPIRLVLADGTPMHTKWYCNGVFSGTNYLTIMDADGTGALRCYHEYQYLNVKTERIREFHSLILQAIMAGVNDPSLTVGSILNMIDYSPEKVAENLHDELSGDVIE